MGMFGFGMCEEAVERGGEWTLATRWVEGWKSDEKGGALRETPTGWKEF